MDKRIPNTYCKTYRYSLCKIYSHLYIEEKMEQSIIKKYKQLCLHHQISGIYVIVYAHTLACIRKEIFQILEKECVFDK